MLYPILFLVLIAFASFSGLNPAIYLWLIPNILLEVDVFNHRLDHAIGFWGLNVLQELNLARS